MTQCFVKNTFDERQALRHRALHGSRNPRVCRGWACFGNSMARINYELRWGFLFH